MSQRLRLPTGRLVFFRKRLDRKLQAIRKRVTRKHVTKTYAKEQGTLILRSHYRDIIAFVANYLKTRGVDQRFTVKEFEPDIKEAVESWEAIVDDL